MYFQLHSSVILTFLTEMFYLKSVDFTNVDQTNPENYILPESLFDGFLKFGFVSSERPNLMDQVDLDISFSVEY